MGIEDAQVAPDGTAGWLVRYKVDTVEHPVAGKLILWRAGRVIQTFKGVPSFWNWSFEAKGQQVAYRGGPLHGMTVCELREVSSGRLIAKWDFESGSKRPPWTAGLGN